MKKKYFRKKHLKNKLKKKVLNIGKIAEFK
jgi:hypothetical protein